MSETTETTVENATQDTLAAAGADRVKAFASALKQENQTEDDQATNTETTTPAAKPTAAKTSASVDEIKAAFKSVDIKKLAELLGETDTGKIAKTEWAQYRIKDRDSKREARAAREQIETERATIAKEREQLMQSSATIARATEALQRDDYVTFLEIATGKPIKDIVDVIADDLTDPNKRELRQLRGQTEKQQREFAEQQRRMAAEQAQKEATAAKTQYVSSLRREISDLEFAKGFLEEYGDPFVDLVFTEQQRSWDGERTVTAEVAAKRVLKQQRAYFDRAKKHFESLGDVDDSKPGKSTVKKGSQGARLSPRKPISQSQGGSGPSRELSPQERIAYFARVLKAEHV